MIFQLKNDIELQRIKKYYNNFKKIYKIKLKYNDLIIIKEKNVYFKK